jgi:hypothetical protein
VSDNPPFTTYPISVWGLLECPYDKNGRKCCEISDDNHVNEMVDGKIEQTITHSGCFFYKEYKEKGFLRYYCERVAREELEFRKIIKELEG